MALRLENELLGYAVTTWADHACIGNPDLLLYSNHTGSYHTGSVEVYKYNINKDAHDLIATLHSSVVIDTYLLAAESGSGTGSIVSGSLRTEQNGIVRRTDFMDLLIDEGDYLTKEDDAYGQSLDLWNNFLVVGCKYFHQKVVIGPTSGSTSGSFVDIYNLDKIVPIPFTDEIVVSQTGFNLAAGILYYTASIPPNYDVVEVLFATDPIPQTYSEWIVVDKIYPPPGGGVIYYAWPTSGPSGYLAFRCTHDYDPKMATLMNPDPEISNSFGHKVAVNENWIAVSSINYNNLQGAVYIYNKTTDSVYTTASNNYVSWSLYQVIQPSDIMNGDMFGWDIDINKQSGSYSGSLLVGTYRVSSSKAYLFEFKDSVWQESYQFNPETGSQHLTFYDSQPVYSGSDANPVDGYGQSVALWENVYVIGAPTDRYVYEYSGSSLYQQGAAYIYESCEDVGTGIRLVLKTYGGEKILKKNRLGESVDIHEGNVVIGAPKPNNLTSCYIQGTLFENSIFLENQDGVNGQFVLVQKNTSSMDWEITNVYQTKKQYFEPCVKYGYDVAVHDNFIVVGAPMLLTDGNRLIDPSDVNNVESISGKSYIYNFNNFQTKFYVGNVFYRNGVLVINTSGSVFENLFLDSKTSYEYQYTLDYKSKQTMYESQIVCSVEPGEFNVSTNPTAITRSCPCLDMNGNGVFDFQDVDVLLKYMQYQNSKFSSNINSNWSQSLSLDDGEKSFFQWSADQYIGTDNLYSSSYQWIDSNLKMSLDINQDSKIDTNDMYIMWKYFSNRLNQKNYETYITPLSTRILYSDVSDFLNSTSGRDAAPTIKSEFLNYESKVNADPTGSYLAPFVTAIGLYNGMDLVAVAKLGNPVKLTPDFPYNFVVKLDF
jgi:hypothetical protein